MKLTFNAKNTQGYSRLFGNFLNLKVTTLGERQQMTAISTYKLFSPFCCEIIENSNELKWPCPCIINIALIKLALECFDQNFMSFLVYGQNILTNF